MENWEIRVTINGKVRKTVGEFENRQIYEDAFAASIFFCDSSALRSEVPRSINRLVQRSTSST